MKNIRVGLNVFLYFISMLSVMCMCGGISITEAAEGNYVVPLIHDTGFALCYALNQSHESPTEGQTESQHQIL